MKTVETFTSRPAWSTSQRWQEIGLQVQNLHHQLEPKFPYQDPTPLILGEIPKGQRAGVEQADQLLKSWVEAASGKSLSYQDLFLRQLFDLEQLVKELVVGELETRYSYALDLESDNWWGAGYEQSLTALGANFVTAILAKGWFHHRAVTEHLVLHHLQNKLVASHRPTSPENSGRHESVPTRYYFVISPPDSVEAGYHGSHSLQDWSQPETEHHAFGYLMGAEDGAVHVTQFRTWDNLQELAQLHHRLSGLTVTPTQTGYQVETVDPTQPAFTIPAAQLPQVLFANVIEIAVPASTTRAEVEAWLRQELYHPDRTKHWGFQPHQLPILSPEYQDQLWEHLFGVNTQELARLYFLDSRRQLGPLSDSEEAEYEKLVHQTMDEPSLLEALVAPKTWKAFKRVVPRENRRTPFTGRMRTRSAIEVALAQQVFLATADKWVRYGNQNPAFVTRATTNPDLTDSEQSSNPWSKWLHFKTSQSINMPPLELDKLSQLWRTQTQLLIDPSSVSDAEKQWLAKEAPFLITIGEFALGSAQCYILTPFTAPISVLKAATGIGGGPGMGLNTETSSYHWDNLLDGLSTEQLKALHHHLTTLKYVELKLPGTDEVWMVPDTYLTGLGCDVDPTSGKVWGPCVDPETNQRIYLDDARDTMALRLTADQFPSFKQAVLKKVSQLSWADLTHQALDATADSSQKPHVRYVLNQLERLIFKPRLTLNELINDDIIATKAWVHDWLHELLQSLISAGNPIPVLYQAFHQLLEHQPDLTHHPTVQALGLVVDSPSTPNHEAEPTLTAA